MTKVVHHLQPRLVMKGFITDPQDDFVLISHQVSFSSPKCSQTHPVSVGRSARFVVQGKMKKSPRACFSPSLGLPADRRPRAPSLAAQRSLRGTNAPKDPVVLRSSRLAGLRGPETRPGEARRGFGELARETPVGDRLETAREVPPPRAPRTPPANARARHPPRPRVDPVARRD